MRKRTIHLVLALGLLIGLLPLAQVYAINQDGFTFFVPYSVDELAEQFLEGQREWNTVRTPSWEPDEIVVTVSVSILRTGTTLYYDHWEDGYEANITSPTQASTPPTSSGGGSSSG